MNNTTNTNDNIDEFIINTILIDPINKIISGLKDRNYRDCDMEWLNNKLKGYIEFAGQTIGISIPAHLDSVIGGNMNDYNNNRFIDKFTVLLNYFTTIVK